MAKNNAPILRSRSGLRPVLETTLQPYSHSNQVQMIWAVKRQLNPFKKKWAWAGDSHPLASSAYPPWVQNPTGKTLSPAVPCLLSSAHSVMAWAPWGFGSPVPIALPLSADSRIFSPRLTPLCLLQLCCTNVPRAGHLQCSGICSAALISGYIKASHNILSGPPCGGFDSATHCFSGCPLGSHQKPPWLQNSERAFSWSADSPNSEWAPIGPWLQQTPRSWVADVWKHPASTSLWAG